MSTLPLFLGVATGAIGFGYVVYGKKQGRLVPAIAGIVLCVLPYVLDSGWLLLLASLLLMAAPFLIEG